MASVSGNCLTEAVLNLHLGFPTIDRLRESFFQARWRQEGPEWNSRLEAGAVERGAVRSQFNDNLLDVNFHSTRSPIYMPKAA
jgi:hypothetical protein